MIRGFYLAGVGVEFFAGVFTPLCRFSGFFSSGVTGSKKRGRGFDPGSAEVKNRGRGFYPACPRSKTGSGFLPRRAKSRPREDLGIH